MTAKEMFEEIGLQELKFNSELCRQYQRLQEL